MKTDLAEAAWWLFWTFVLVAGAIRQVRDGGTWIPAGSVVIALLSYSNFLRVAARLRAQREGRVDAR